jgi:flagellar biosynthesis/type III secretory pathway protein FliH
MAEVLKGRIHLRRPIKELRVVFHGPEPVPASEAQTDAQAAYDRGRSDVEAVCQRQIVEARREMSQLQNEVLASIQSRFAEFEEQFDRQLPDLVLSIVGKIWEGVRMDRETVLKAIDAALEQVGSDTTKLVVRLSKGDAALLQESESFMSRYPDLSIETDPELGTGDVVIRSRFGVVDSRVGTKIRRIEQEIRKAHQ